MFESGPFAAAMFQMMPDMGHPVHGSLLDAAWPSYLDPLHDGPGLNTFFAPSGRPALALSAVLLEVVRGLTLEQNPSVHPVAISLLNQELRNDPLFHFDLIEVSSIIHKLTDHPYEPSTQ